MQQPCGAEAGCAEPGVIRCGDWLRDESPSFPAEALLSQPVPSSNEHPALSFCSLPSPIGRGGVMATTPACRRDRIRGKWVEMERETGSGAYWGFIAATMATLWGIAALFSVGLLCGLGEARAQDSYPGAEASPAQPLVRGFVDDARRVTLHGNVHPLAQPRYDRGRVEDSLEATHLHLVLNRSAAQEQALQQFLLEAHTSGAPGYHRWLTPQEFGRRFGAADSDVAAVTAWLESQGLT